ncbi:MAG: RecX family transcriptional regulator [Cellulosilyticaceae bacterium]
MKTITKVEVQKKNPERVSVFIDEVFAFGAYVDDAYDYGIKKGVTLDDEAYEELLYKLQFRKAKYTALEYIKTGNKTAFQVIQKLKEKEYDEGVIERILTFLKEYNFIDDEDFKNRYIEYQTSVKHKSIRKIQYELHQKGVENNDFGNTLEEMSSVELQNIEYYLRKYGYNTALEYNQKQKIVARLVRRGFSYDNIKNVIGEIGESFDI